MPGPNAFPSPAGPDGLQTISGGCGDSDTLRLFTGELIKSISVVSVRTVGLPLVFRMTYHAQDTVNSVLGPKWRHNYMMGLTITGSPPTLVTFTDAGGPEYSFTWDGTTWVRASTSYFLDAVLTESGDTWLLTYPDTTQYVFDSLGRLLSISDPHTNTTTLTWTGPRLTKVTEPKGRSILLGYSPDGRMTSIVDPMANFTLLVYSSASPYNLEQVVGPAGCVTRYAHTDGTDPSVITMRTDANGNSYSYEHDTDQRIVSIQDAELTPNTLTYSYDTATEFTSDLGDSQSFPQTTLLDARGKTWRYRFDNAGLLWRVLDPSNHWKHTYHDANQRLLYVSSGFPEMAVQDTVVAASARDSMLNSTQRFVYDNDGSGNSNSTLLYQSNGVGMVTHMEYNEQRYMTAIYPGRAHFGVQGNWPGQFGADGYLLCAYNDDTSDLTSLPAYIDSVSAGSSSPTTITDASHRADPRALTSPSGLGRAVGIWSSDSEFTVTVTLTTEASFNLSVYSASADAAVESTNPFQYCEQFGRDMVLTVVDLSGTATFRLTNNAVGAWMTFPVSGDADNAITVTITPAGANTGYAGISALAFDPYDNHRTVSVYNDVGDVLSQTDGLGNESVMTWNDDGTLETYTDALTRETQLFYEDDYLNLTRVRDADLNDTVFSFDLNGNQLTIMDANSHTWTTSFDGRNRPLTTVSPLGQTTVREWDGVGNLLSWTNAAGHTWRWLYSPTNRPVQVISPLGDTIAITYDEAGNVLSITNERDFETQTTYDDSGRRIATTRPDTGIVAQAWDAMDRAVAVTSPNGNQSTVDDINLLGAANMLYNPGAEISDGIAPARALGWTMPRDTTVSHTGTTSFKALNGSGGQRNVGLMAGVRSVLSYWLKTDGAVNVTATATMAVRAVDASYVSFTPLTTVISSGTSTWVNSATQRFDIPGDTQYALLPCEMVSFDRTPETAHTWYDDMLLNSLSTAMLYDGQGRLTSVMLPDGTAIKLVRDRWGRIVRMVDQRGYVATIAYDCLDQVIAQVDPLGNRTTFTWDAVGNLVAVSDANTNETQYTPDNLNRLSTITYADATTEVFTWDPVGNLATYTNARGQERVFTFDDADRLTQTLYSTDSSTVTYAYDVVNNLVTRTDRNGDVTRLEWDPVHRLVSMQRNIGGSFDASTTWYQQHVYDAASNRIEFDNGLASSAVYDTALFDTDVFIQATVQWQVPSGGYDSMNRLSAYEDSAASTTTIDYDIEGRPITVTYPNGTTPPVTSLVFDLVGRLLGMDTAEDATNLLPVAYAYDPASNRLAAMVGGDMTWYFLDPANRLVREDLNTFADSTHMHFANAMASTGVDFSDGVLTLMPWGDTFQDSAINADRWRLAYRNTVGNEAREKEDGLHLAFPRGYCNLLNFHDENAVNAPPIAGYTMGTGDLLAGVGAEQWVLLSGDFDIQVDFANFVGAPSANGFTGLPTALAGLMVSSKAFETAAGFWFNIVGDPFSFGMFITSAGKYQGVTTSFIGPIGGTASTTDTSGRLRITRSGDTATGYYWDGSTWQSVYTTTGFSTADMKVSVSVQVQAGGFGAGTLTNFTNNLATYMPDGLFTSRVFDAGQSVTWDSIAWDATTPTGTSVQFQVATSSSVAGPFTYVGPDGTSGTYFTSSGTALYTATTGRYCSYQASLSGTTSATPTITEVAIYFDGTNTSTSTHYEYDGVGNTTGKVTESPGVTTVTETRTVNNLNQITANTVVGSSTVNWAYTFDDDGNLTSRSDGTNTTTYAWDEDNRLTLVTLPDTSTVGYTWDVSGRMLTRTDSAGTTTFVWDGMDCVGETDPSDNVTLYNMPGPQGGIGTMMSFSRNGSMFQVHTDALGSIRKVTDDTGAVVATFDFDAYGNPLASCSDSVPDGGLAYRFVGAAGVRWDAGTGLYYMRARWYDPTLQRFLSRDALGAMNRYAYCLNNPTSIVDTNGLQPQGPFPYTMSKKSSKGPAGQSVNSLADIQSMLDAAQTSVGCYGKCFLVCTRDLPDPRNPSQALIGRASGVNVRHPFLVFGGRQQSGFYGLKSPQEMQLAQPGVQIDNPVISDVDYLAVTDKNRNWNVQCRVYCGPGKDVGNVYQYAQQGKQQGLWTHDYSDRPGESIDWVDAAMSQGGFLNSQTGHWQGYGGPATP